jgi:diguanylate cyclase (GGDEF)-like protein/PAS domain S-box-containing protein
MHKFPPSLPGVKQSHRQWWALLLALLLVASGVGLLLWQDLTHRLSTENDRLQVQARVIDEQLAQQIKSTNQVLHGIRDELNSWAGPGYQERVSGRLKALTDAMPGVSQIGVVDSQGLLLITGRGSATSSRTPDGVREFFLSPRTRANPDMLYVSEPLPGPNGVRGILLGRAILDAETGFAGMVYARLEPEFFSGVMRSVLYAPDMVASIRTRSGQLVLQLTTGTQEILQREGDSDSLHALRTVKPTLPLMDKPLVIQVAREAAEVYAPWLERLGLTAGVFALLALLSALALTWWQHQRQVQASFRAQRDKDQRHSEQRFRSLTELSSDWYWETDTEFRFIRIDGDNLGTTGLPSQYGIGRTRWEIPAINMTELQWQAHRDVLRSHQTFRDLELERVNVKGETIWITESGIPVFDDAGQFTGYRGVGRNVTARKLAELKIEQLAFYDDLTGLPNRRLLSERLHKALSAVVRNQRHGALIFIDLDNFKVLNDTQGHDVGDELLRQVALRLRECVREIDTIARLGGDEFVIMLEELSPYPGEAALQANAAAKKILAMLNLAFDLRGQLHHSTPSIGIALFHDQMQSVDELLKRADLAMYQSKAAGRNTLRFYDPGMQAVATARANMENELREGLQRNELQLYFQPVVDADRAVEGVEALVRWRHPERGLIGPSEFIGLAEQSGLIIPLGRWVLQEACEQLVAWALDDSTRDLTVAVNVSARQFRQPDFAELVMHLLQKTGANPYRLKLELTESLLLVDMELAIRKMSELRAIGVGFALDDFGTGYSSLSYLKSLPLDQIKIDQSFVRDVLTDPNDAAIVRTILALASSMDLVAVAEGVESEEQWQFLLDNGCSVFQGYLFGRPRPVHAPGMTFTSAH